MCPSGQVIPKFGPLTHQLSSLCGLGFKPRHSMWGMYLTTNCPKVALADVFIWGFASLSTLYRSYHDG